jgi:ATP adenylyltransferase
MEYIESPKPGGCIFCQKPEENDDKTNLIVFRGQENFVMLNAYPYNPGHVIVVPRRHVGRIDELTEEEAGEHFALVIKSTGALERAMAPHGFNTGMNLGMVAGAGIVDHVHTHVVPRWHGDTNFMPVVADTKVMPQALADTYDKMMPFFEALAGS